MSDARGWRTLSVEVVATCVISALLLLYAGDYLVLRLRMVQGGTDGATSTVTVFYAAPIKGEKMTVYYDQPQPQTCVRSIFPWMGYQPCWYLRRHTVTLASQERKPSVSL
jgi:hypothetical protein